MEKYDVFISCKSEDYKYAEELHKFLTDNHINAFLASKELRKLGDSEYRETIEEALEEAEHLIIFASNAEYIKSKWVKYEWGLFINAKLDDSKSGNIITILKDVETKNIPFALRKYESLTLDNYQESILGYVDTESSKKRRLLIEKTKEEELKKKDKEQEERIRKENLRIKLATLAEEYRKAQSSLSVDANKIFSVLGSLDIKRKKCVICQSENDIKSAYCQNCGWPTSPIDGVDGLEYLCTSDEESQKIYRHIYSEYKVLKSKAADTFNDSTAENRTNKSSDNQSAPSTRNFWNTLKSKIIIFFPFLLVVLIVVILPMTCHRSDYIPDFDLAEPAIEEVVPAIEEDEEDENQQEESVAIFEPSKFPQKTFVDLGLSVLWYSHNVGAKKASDIGQYYKWGALKPFTSQDIGKKPSWENDKPNEISGNDLYDVATANNHTINGKTFRMPTAEEFQELLDNCIWEYGKLENQIGYSVTSTTTKEPVSIFLPLAGYYSNDVQANNPIERNRSLYYWSGTIQQKNPNLAIALECRDGQRCLSSPSQVQGLLIRPVAAK
ncbi:MAG: toll/interleukin-1 receptor domain-containing protein [Muribaculaceae bacterium]|nr:toll/interleukin-1 receptor domain-containing protein [Muribaculaceae bacterium]